MPAGTSQDCGVLWLSCDATGECDRERAVVAGKPNEAAGADIGGKILSLVPDETLLLAVEPRAGQ